MIAGCLTMNSLWAQTDTTDWCRLVDPFIGTEEMGHTFPGAAVPFGMVQLSPETDTIQYSVNGKYNPEVYRYCAGYQYRDSTIVGFSHTHFSGTGHSDLGDFLLMPTVGKLLLNPGTSRHPETGYRSSFRHGTEVASPGYYKVFLDDYKIKAELTATTHVGFHRYTYPKTSKAHLIMDLNYGIYNYPGKVLWSYVRVENDTLVTGYRITRGWARTRYIYFAMTFSRPIKDYGYQDDENPVYKGFWRKFDQQHHFPEMAGKKVVGWFDFNQEDGRPLEVKMALSAVSTAGALKNLEAELPGWDFDKVRRQAHDRWEKELDKIRIEAPHDQMISFYTSMYHSFLDPIQYNDVDGKYRGLDQNIYMANGFTDYSIFSLWDTYRALHPLFTLIQPQRDGDMVESMLKHWEQSVHHLLPVWSHYSNENWCMIGYHAVSVIADAWMKGIRNFDGKEALKAMVASSTHRNYEGIGDYMDNGYVSDDHQEGSASLTLEYAYDDWTIAQMARSMGQDSLAGVYQRRAENYRHLYDPKVGFIRAKAQDGTWKTPFSPLKTTGEGYVEGNAWNYTFYEPQDVAGYIRLTGGNKAFVQKLDSLFEMQLPDQFFEQSEDIERVGIVGGYVQGNEPSHHIPYLYDYAGEPWKTQQRIHQIVASKYLPTPGGLCGNDDCGQMSAWYIFSSMGFYPVCPGSNQYVIGSPCVKKAVISVGKGKTFTVLAPRLSAKNIYIRSVLLNGRKWNKTWLTHQDIINGGTLIFNMGNQPNKHWGIAADSRPYSLSSGQ